jgi:hypothetical protein
MDEPVLLHKARYRAAALAGTMVEHLPLNTITRHVDSDHVYYHKRRRWYAPFLIFCARLTGARFTVLSGRQWHDWESAIYQQIYSIKTNSIADGTLILPALPGVQLTTVLATQANSAQSMAGVTAALRALQALHQQEIILPDGDRRLFCHGDATIGNVLFDPASGEARWFDFETAPGPGRSHHWGCADDLRALLFSAATLLGRNSITPLASLIVAEYNEPLVLQELQQIVTALLDRPDSLHLAQTRVPYRLGQAFGEALLVEMTR